MRAIVLALCCALAPVAAAQPVLKAVQVAEVADDLSQLHDAASSPDGRLIYVTDMRNSRFRVLEAMPLKLVGSFGERGRGTGEFHGPEAVLARAPHVRVIDTYNDRIGLLRVE